MGKCGIRGDLKNPITSLLYCVGTELYGFYIFDIRKYNKLQHGKFSNSESNDTI